MLQMLNSNLMIILCIYYQILMIIICATVDLSDTSSFPFKILLLKSLCMPPNPHTFLCPRGLFVVTHLLNVLYNTLHLSSIGFTIIDALKFTKSRKMSKSDLTIIDFENIMICDVKCLPSSFDGDILFILSPMPLGVPSGYGRSMDGIDKMCNGHPWCTTKTTNIQKDFGLFF